jgi:hypothetical protein
MDSSENYDQNAERYFETMKLSGFTTPVLDKQPNH